PRFPSSSAAHPWAGSANPEKSRRFAISWLRMKRLTSRDRTSALTAALPRAGRNTTLSRRSTFRTGGGLMTRDFPTLSRQSADRIWRDSAETPLMIKLLAGEFMMGENEGDKFANDTERPAHPVRIAVGLALGCFPVTVGEFRCFR